MVIVADGDLLVDPDGTPLDAAHCNAAHILIIINGGYQQLQGCAFIAFRGINIVDDGFK